MKKLKEEAQAVGEAVSTDLRFRQFHWTMRLMSVLSLLTLGLYSYVLKLCQHEAKSNLQFPQTGSSATRRRVRLASTAFSLDLLISAYFSAVTPILLKECGVVLNRKTMPRPLFWFFAITGFVPTVSMTFTVLSGHFWHERIRQQKSLRLFHGLVAIVAYFPWSFGMRPGFCGSVAG